MTPTGNSLLEEYVNETKERIDDDKNQLYLDQGKNTGYMLWRGLIYVPTSFFFGIWITATFIMLSGIAEVEVISSIRQATDQEISEGLRAILYFGLTFALIGPAYIASRYYRNKQDERVWTDQKRVWQKKDHIELIEELMLRHGLIEKIEAEAANEKAN